MGTANTGRDCLQGITDSWISKWLYYATVSLLLFTNAARAEIFPVRATLTYTASAPQSARLTIEATDGKSYALLLRPQKTAAADFIDLILLPVGAKEDARNLLEPKAWHGHQKFMLAGWDYVNGPDKSTFGRERTFNLKGERLSVKATVSKVEVKPIKGSTPNAHTFTELVLDIEVSNLK